MADQTLIVEVVQNPTPALGNPAIAKCARAWDTAYRIACDNGDEAEAAASKAAEAYRATLPPLTTRQDCRDFIACVAHGILLGAIAENNAGKLLYAAQIAISAFGAEEKSQRYAGYAAYANLTATEAAHVKKFMPQRSKIS